MAIMVKIGQMIILAAKLDMCHELDYAIVEFSAKKYQNYKTL